MVLQNLWLVGIKDYMATNSDQASWKVNSKTVHVSNMLFLTERWSHNGYNKYEP